MIMKDCIFCKIIAEQAPGKLEAIDDYWFTLIPIDPVVKGHTLVIPKKHADNILDLDKKNLNALGSVLQKVAKQVKADYNAEGINILAANGEAAQQTVFHLHFHIVPRYEDDGLDLWFQQQH